MNNQSSGQPFILLFSILILGLFGLVGYLMYQNTQLQQQLVRQAGQENTQPKETGPTKNQPSPTPTSDPYAGWDTYTSEEYDFEFKYPADYKALDDEDNLYGWPNAVVMLYKGGQTYDIPVEIWDTKADYEQKYANRLDQLEVKKLGEKYVTFSDNTDSEEFSKIIASFRVI